MALQEILFVGVDMLEYVMEMVMLFIHIMIIKILEKILLLMSLNGIKDLLKDIGDFNFVYKSLFSLKNFAFFIFFF